MNSLQNYMIHIRSPQKPVSLEAQDWQQWTYATVAACTFGFQIEQNRPYRAS